MASFRPTIKDVAKLAGVVPSTVSQALNGKKYVDENTRKRVFKAAKELGYRPNPHAQQLRAGGLRSIALISGMPFGVAAGPSRLGFLMEIAAVAAEAALSRGMALTLVPPMPTTNGQSVVFGLPPGLDMDGVLVVEPSEADPQLEILLQASIPVVCVGKSPDHPEVPWVDLHTEATADLLFQHLQASGSRRPALLVGTRRRASYLGTEVAYLRFCAEQGIAPVIYRAEEEGGEMAGQAATAGLLAAHPDMDGLCALVDAFAVGAIRAALSRNLRIPEDLRVVTRYDGLRAKTCIPALTAVNLHLEEVGALAVELLFTLMSGNSVGTLYPSAPELVTRESSVGFKEPLIKS